jgi:hypothetical protein
MPNPSLQVIPCTLLVKLCKEKSLARGKTKLLKHVQVGRRKRIILELHGLNYDTSEQ